MLRKTHIQKISVSITRFLVQKNALSASETAVEGTIEKLIVENMEKERSIEDEAHKLLDKNRKTMGADIDEQKAFFLIKRQLAKQKNFVL